MGSATTPTPTLVEGVMQGDHRPSKDTIEAFEEIGRMIEGPSLGKGYANAEEMTEDCYDDELIPTDETLEAMAEAELMDRDPSLGKSYTDVRAMMAELLADARN